MIFVVVVVFGGRICSLSLSVSLACSLARALLRASCRCGCQLLSGGSSDLLTIYYLSFIHSFISFTISALIQLHTFTPFFLPPLHIHVHVRHCYCIVNYLLSLYIYENEFLSFFLSYFLFLSFLSFFLFLFFSFLSCSRNITLETR